MDPASRQRLRASRDVVAVLRGRRQRAGHLAVVHVAPGIAGVVRIAVVASRRVGPAVSRNRAKRVLREAAATIDWSPGTDVVLVARGACAQARPSEVADELAALAAALHVVRREQAVPQGVASEGAA